MQHDTSEGTVQRVQEAGIATKLGKQLLIRENIMLSFKDRIPSKEQVVSLLFSRFLLLLNMAL